MTNVITEEKEKEREPGATVSGNSSPNGSNENSPTFKDPKSQL